MPPGTPAIEIVLFTPILVYGIPLDFILFALTLLGVAIFHHHTLAVALTGLAAIVAYKLMFTGFARFGSSSSAARRRPRGMRDVLR